MFSASKLQLFHPSVIIRSECLVAIVIIFSGPRRFESHSQRLQRSAGESWPHLIGAHW